MMFSDLGHRVHSLTNWAVSFEAQDNGFNNQSPYRAKGLGFQDA